MNPVQKNRRSETVYGNETGPKKCAESRKTSVPCDEMPLGIVLSGLFTMLVGLLAASRHLLFICIYLFYYTAFTNSAPALHGIPLEAAQAFLKKLELQSSNINCFFNICLSYKEEVLFSKKKKCKNKTLTQI